MIRKIVIYIFIALFGLTVIGFPYSFVTGNRVPIIGHIIAFTRSILRLEQTLDLSKLDKKKLKFNELPKEVQSYYIKGGGAYFTNLSNDYVDYEYVNGYETVFYIFVYGMDYDAVYLDGRYKIVGILPNYVLYSEKIYHIKKLNNVDKGFVGSEFYVTDVSKYLK